MRDSLRAVRGWGRGYAMEEFRSAMVPPGSEQHLGLSRRHLGLRPQAGPQVAAHLPPPHPNIHSQHPETTYLLCPLPFLGLRLSSQSWCAPTHTPRYPRTGGVGKGTVASVLSVPPLSTHSHTLALRGWSKPTDLTPPTGLSAP